MEERMCDRKRCLEEIKKQLEMDTVVNLMLAAIASKDEEVMKKGEGNLVYTLYLALVNAIALEEKISCFLKNSVVSNITSEN